MVHDVLIYPSQQNGSDSRIKTTNNVTYRSNYISQTIYVFAAEYTEYKQFSSFKIEHY